MSGALNSGATTVSLRLQSMFAISATVGPFFSHWIMVPVVDSIAAIKLYLILKVLRICGFFGSGVLKHKWL